MALACIAIPADELHVDAMLDLGASGVRFTADPRFDQPGMLEELWRNTLLSVITFHGFSFPNVDFEALRQAGPDGADWRPVQDQLRWYRDQWTKPPHIINVWNEWRGTGGDEESPNPAWIVNGLAMQTREVFGPNQRIAHGSIVDGQPSSLQELNWVDVDYADCHEYGKVSRNWSGDPMTGVLDVTKYRRVLPARIGIIISEIGMSSWPDEANPDSETPESEAFQAAYLEDIMGYGRIVPDLYLITWFAYHNHRGFGLYRAENGSRKQSYWAFQRAAGGPTEPKPPEPPMPEPTTIPEQSYRAWWAAVRHDAEYNHGFEIETYWREHMGELGPTLDDHEYSDGGYQWRTFQSGALRWSSDKGVELVLKP